MKLERLRDYYELFLGGGGGRETQGNKRKRLTMRKEIKQENNC